MYESSPFQFLNCYALSFVYIAIKKMKRIILLIVTLALYNCSSDNDESIITGEIPEAILLGRWNLEGFEGNVLYEFTEDKRYTFYSEDGNFPTLEEAQQQSGFNGLDWYYEGEKVTIDLNFGNYSTLTPQVVCDNYVIKWNNDDREIHSIYFRDDYEYS